MSNINLYKHRFSIVLDSESSSKSVIQYLSAASISRWVEQSPSARAIMTLDSGDTVSLPMFALRRRNAVVATQPDAPLQRIAA
ncbi:hypothetical protein BDB01DRAFT_769210 [Pilobolus umbonatus]|nr:hypothetical protein BDB01DRAFT_769210 [Pilobolus umbonatus]